MILRKEKVSVFAFQANMYAIILCKLFGVKIITRSNSSPSGWSKNILKNYIFKKVLKLADVVIVNSNEFKYEMRKKFNINTNCIYNPLNKNEIVKLSKESLKFKFFDVKKNIIKIINIGRFVDQKDQITILKALNSIKEKINFRAIIMGKGEQKKLFMNFIKSNNLKNKIKIINYQKNPYKYIRKSNLFILSSIFEGLPNVLLESMVLKKLILSTKCPTGPKEILENGKYGLFFKIRDHENLAKMIIYSYRNYNKLLSKVNSGYLSINRFDKKINLNKYLKVVKKVLNV